jgi:FMN phosphatase YigB (HAD superfamily)
VSAARPLFIFDMGGVVSRATDVAPEIALHLGLAEAEFLRLAGEDLGGLQAGAVSPALFWRRFAETSGIPVHDELWGRFFRPVLDPEVVAEIGRLKSRGRVVCGTNTVAPHYAIHAGQGDYDCFDAVYASHLMGVAKPDSAFYLRILREEGTAPEDAFFVDDVAANVEAALRLGIAGRVFTGARDLAALLGLEAP